MNIVKIFHDAANDGKWGSTSECDRRIGGNMHNQIQLPQEFVALRDVYVFQLFGRNGLEPIPPGAVILAARHSSYVRMIEAIWQDKEYIVFERDLRECMVPVKNAEVEGDSSPVLDDDRKSA